MTCYKNLKIEIISFNRLRRYNNSDICRDEKDVVKNVIDHSLLLETFAKLCIQMNDKVTAASQEPIVDAVSKLTLLLLFFLFPINIIAHCLYYSDTNSKSQVTSMRGRIKERSLRCRSTANEITEPRSFTRQYPYIHVEESR